MDIQNNYLTITIKIKINLKSQNTYTLQISKIKKHISQSLDK